MERNSFHKKVTLLLKGDGAVSFVRLKVGYIIMTSDKAGLERKFY